jgi:hypothetical protein
VEPIDYQQWLVRQIFADRSLPHSLRVALERGLVPRQYLRAAWALLQSYPYPRQPQWSIPATPEDAPPSWDNVVRALDEDR